MPAGMTGRSRRVYDLFPRLEERRNNKGGNLSGGEQQMLTVVRTLMGNPRVILIDEPTEGLAPLIVKDVLEMLSTVRKSGVTVLMVEQNFKAAIKIADRFYIMSKGQIVFEGDTAGSSGGGRGPEEIIWRFENFNKQRKKGRCFMRRKMLGLSVLFSWH